MSSPLGRKQSLQNPLQLSGLRKMSLYIIENKMREWRNWQTHQT